MAGQEKGASNWSDGVGVMPEAAPLAMPDTGGILPQAIKDAAANMAAIAQVLSSDDYKAALSGIGDGANFQKVYAALSDMQQKDPAIAAQQALAVLKDMKAGTPQYDNVSSLFNQDIGRLEEKGESGTASRLLAQSLAPGSDQQALATPVERVMQAAVNGLSQMLNNSSAVMFMPQGSDLESARKVVDALSALIPSENTSPSSPLPANWEATNTVRYMSDIDTLSKSDPGAAAGSIANLLAAPSVQELQSKGALWDAMEAYTWTLAREIRNSDKDPGTLAQEIQEASQGLQHLRDKLPADDAGEIERIKYMAAALDITLVDPKPAPPKDANDPWEASANTDMPVRSFQDMVSHVGYMPNFSLQDMAANAGIVPDATPPVAAPAGGQLDGP